MLNALKKRMSSDNRNDAGFSFTELFMVAIIIGILIAIAIPVFSAIGERERQNMDEDGMAVNSMNEETADGIVGSDWQEPVNSEPEPSEPINWQPLIWVGSGFGGLVLISSVGYGGYRLFSSANKKKTENKEIANSWQQLLSRKSDVLTEYASYETDIWKALKYPALHDVEVDETSVFMKTLRDVNSIEKTLDTSKQIPGSYTLYGEYSKLVSNLENDFVQAKNRAYRLGDSNLSESEQKDIRTAIHLLKHAEDGANTVEVRQTYYEQLRKVVDRLNQRHGTHIIPQKTLTILADNTRLLLTENTVLNDVTENNIMTV